MPRREYAGLKVAPKGSVTKQCMKVKPKAILWVITNFINNMYIKIFLIKSILVYYYTSTYFTFYFFVITLGLKYRHRAGVTAQLLKCLCYNHEDPVYGQGWLPGPHLQTSLAYLASSQSVQTRSQEARRELSLTSPSSSFSSPSSSPFSFFLFFFYLLRIIPNLTYSKVNPNSFKNWRQELTRFVKLPSNLQSSRLTPLSARSCTWYAS